MTGNNEFEEDMKKLAKLHDEYAIIPRVRKSYEIAYQKYVSLLKELSGKYHMDNQDLRQSYCMYCKV